MCCMCLFLLEIDIFLKGYKVLKVTSYECLKLQVTSELKFILAISVQQSVFGILG